MHIVLKWIAGMSAFLAVTLSTPVLAAQQILLDVGGPENTIETIRAGNAAAVSFSLDSARSNVSIDANILCISCQGGIWFQKDAVGATATFAGALGGEAYNALTPRPYFTFGALDAGTYFFIVSINANSVGSALWAGSSTPTIVSDGANRLLDFRATSTTAFVPLSNFNVVFGKNLNFTVFAAAPVPEPRTWAMFIVGFGLVGTAVRQKSARALRAV